MLYRHCGLPFATVRHLLDRGGQCRLGLGDTRFEVVANDRILEASEAFDRVPPPIFDTTMVIFRRWRKGRPIYQADKSHLHHRLLAQGFSQRQTVLILYGISFCLCLMAFGVFLMLGQR